MLISYVIGKQDVQEDKPMGYEPLKYIPLPGHARRSSRSYRKCRKEGERGWMRVDM